MSLSQHFLEDDDICQHKGGSLTSSVIGDHLQNDSEKEDHMAGYNGDDNASEVDHGDLMDIPFIQHKGPPAARENLF